MKQGKGRKKTAQHRKKMTAMFLTALMTVGMAATGCGKKTVDYDVDGDGSNTDVNEDSGSLQGRYGIPESIDETLSTGESGIEKIEIEDDEITVPDTGDMYVAYYKKKETTNETKKQVAEAVFEKDKGIYAYDYENRSKADIQSEIDLYEREKENSTDTDTSYYDEWIDELKTQLASAPDEYPAAGDYEGTNYLGTINDVRYMLTMPDSDGAASYSLYMQDDTLLYRPKDGANGVYYQAFDDYAQYKSDDSPDADDSLNMCSLTEDEARQMAEEFIENVGGAELTMKNSSALCWVYYDTNGETTDVEVDGYEFVFGRTVNNQSVSTVNPWNADNLQQDNGYVEIPSETYTIDIDANGIVYASWTDYLEPDDENEMEAATLLSFDELLAKANETVAAYYTTYTTRYKKVEFNDMTLTYYLKKGENDGEILYAPVWILSQYEEYTDYTDADSPSQLVVLDATDGSVIDLLELSKALGTYYDYSEETNYYDDAVESSADAESTEEESTDAESTDEETTEAEM